MAKKGKPLPLEGSSDLRLGRIVDTTKKPFLDLGEDYPFLLIAMG